jgi:hypothetical protein
MSGGIAFDATITGGIQSITGLLSLLETQHFEVSFGERGALMKGYLYTAATSMSMFGSFLVAKPNFETPISCMSGRAVLGFNDSSQYRIRVERDQSIADHGRQRR